MGVDLCRSQLVSVGVGLFVQVVELGLLELFLLKFLPYLKFIV